MFTILFICMYFLPTFLVKTDKPLMFVLNLLLAWTIIGWIILFLVSIGTFGHHG
jgi:hypothetical protein